MKLILAISIAVAAGSVQSHAQSYMLDGNEMLKICTSGHPVDAGQCRGFVIGSWDAAVFYNHGLFRELCVPNIPASQLEAVMIKYIEDNPADRHKAAAQLFMSSLGDAFPC